MIYINYKYNERDNLMINTYGLFITHIIGKAKDLV